MTERTEPTDAAAGASAKQKRQLGKQVMSPDAIPEGIKAAVADKLGADARAAPAREGGGYKGKVIYANERYMVQAVGQKQENAVVHRKSDVEFVGQKLGWREQNGMLNGVNVQVHYNGDKAKAYVWNQEREQAARAAKSQEAQGPSKDQVEARKVEMAERAKNPNSEAAMLAKEDRKAADMRASSDPATRKLQGQIDQENAAAAKGAKASGKAPEKAAAAPKAKTAAKAPEKAEKAAAAPKAKAATPRARKAAKTPEKAASGPER